MLSWSVRIYGASIHFDISESNLHLVILHAIPFMSL